MVFLTKLLLLLAICCMALASDHSGNSYEEIKKLIKTLNNKVDMLDRKLDNISAEITKPDPLPIDCQDVKDKSGEPDKKSGVYIIEVPGLPRKKVYCHFTNDEAWTSISRRVHEERIFNKTWAEYASGFGKADKDYWIGNEILSSLTNTKNYTLRISMEGSHITGGKAISLYKTVRVGDSHSSYKLFLGEYLANISSGGDSFEPTSKCMQISNRNATFSTYDHGVAKICSQKLSGGWWFTNCGCSNLNGKSDYGGIVSISGDNLGIYWDTLYRDEWGMKNPLKKVVMEISRGSS